MIYITEFYMMISIEGCVCVYIYPRNRKYHLTAGLKRHQGHPTWWWPSLMIWSLKMLSVVLRHTEITDGLREKKDLDSSSIIPCLVLFIAKLWSAWSQLNMETRSVQSLSCVQLLATSWTAARWASLSIANSQSLLKFMCIQSVMRHISSIQIHAFRGWSFGITCTNW